MKGRKMHDVGKEKIELQNSIGRLYDSLKDSSRPKRATLLVKWLRSYAWYLSHEETFSPLKLCKYPRGSIIKVNFGYRVNKEFGGVHYAVVLNRQERQSDDLVTVIPLTSVKPNFNPKHPKYGQVYLGDEIFNLMQDKLEERTNTWYRSIQHVKTLVKEIEGITANADLYLEYVRGMDPQTQEGLDFQRELSRSISVFTEFETYKEIVELEKQHTKKVFSEINFMKSGSIALVNQIMTVSKMRIRDPINSHSAFSGIRVSPDTLNLLDNKIKELFTR